MTSWHLIAGYSLIGGVYLVLSIAAQVVGSLGRPPNKGHLDVNIQFSRFGLCFVASAILLAPIAIAYTGKTTYDIDQMRRANNMLSMYLVIAFAWIIKLQLQFNKLGNRNDN
jgi:hypothetical protein